MQKIVLIYLVGILMLSPIFSEASIAKKTITNSQELSTKNLTDKGRKSKSGTYRKKKGFLGGIFRKKSQCDCPKH